MRPLVLRRLLAGLAALALVLAWAVPAQAAAPVRVYFHVKNFTIAPGTSTAISSLLYADETLPVPAGAVSLQYRFIDQDPAFRFQEAGRPNNCSVTLPDSVEMNCVAEVSALTLAGVDSGVVGFIEIADDGVMGAQATLTATMTVKGHAPVTRTASVTIGEEVDLTAVTGDRIVKVAPGASVDPPLVIANSGSKAVRGVGFHAGHPYFLESRTQFSNCEYIDGRLSGCTFDQTLEPGTTYRVNLPFRVRADTLAPEITATEYRWMTDEELADYRQWMQNGGHEGTGTPGRGGVLRLTPVPTAKASSPQAQLPPERAKHNLKFEFTGRNSADLAAVGATATGAKGAVVTVPVGLVNRGPATLDNSWNSSWLNTQFSVPKGTTAVRVPDGCYPMSADGTDDWTRPGAPGAPRYSCGPSSSLSLLKAGGTAKVAFGLRIDQVIPGARGAVTVGARVHTGWVAELNPANNTAAVVINPAAAPAPGGGEGGGGGLPITGPQGALFGGIGLLLVLGGAAAVFFTRRRSS
ncbi:hypothetical protein [Paractinoplanes lichenicola]|uniref:Gram-positive cocci surface proteins LPxTG domain-containing protein n=1 Tax=Paractinoplanes lichenicola TaxID=2802976 RepID=A0ABS1W1F7_9ACTN|nr:hypothetical protein [Actinoplanes lichenicola]MBL7260573.1 hypothetical protein [Actinoplanes lichenicola]